MQGRILLDRRRGLDQCEFGVPGPTDERGTPETGSPGPERTPCALHFRSAQMLARAERTRSGGQQMPTGTVSARSWERLSIN